MLEDELSRDLYLPSSIEVSLLVLLELMHLMELNLLIGGKMAGLACLSSGFPSPCGLSLVVSESCRGSLLQGSGGLL